MGLGPDFLFPTVFCGEGRGNTHAAISSVLGTSTEPPFALDTGLTGLGQFLFSVLCNHIFVTTSISTNPTKKAVTHQTFIPFAERKYLPRENL